MWYMLTMISSAWKQISLLTHNKGVIKEEKFFFFGQVLPRTAQKVTMCLTMVIELRTSLQLRCSYFAVIYFLIYDTTTISDFDGKYFTLLVTL